MILSMEYIDPIYLRWVRFLEYGYSKVAGNHLQALNDLKKK